MFVFVFTHCTLRESSVFVRKFFKAGTDHDAGMGVSVSASRGAGDRAGTIARCASRLCF